jgi:hypothetical protein
VRPFFIGVPAHGDAPIKSGHDGGVQNLFTRGNGECRLLVGPEPFALIVAGHDDDIGFHRVQDRGEIVHAFLDLLVPLQPHVIGAQPRQVFAASQGQHFVVAVALIAIGIELSVRRGSGVPIRGPCDVAKPGTISAILEKNPEKPQKIVRFIRQ